MRQAKWTLELGGGRELPQAPHLHVYKNAEQGVPIVAQLLRNPTRNHEVASSIPSLAQWVKDLELL